MRIEDLDSSRCRREHEVAILDDLRWLGVVWNEPVRRQSDHRSEYLATANDLGARGLLYPCSCTRGQIAAAGPRSGPEGFVYPGICRGRPMADRRDGDALRLDLARALMEALPLSYEEVGPLYRGIHSVRGKHLVEGIGDPVLVRRLTGDPAYHLAVVHDDALQRITHVVRGADLWAATPLHRLLQHLLGLPVPVWHHHDLVRDDTGRRLAKIDGDRALAALRADGATPQDVASLIGWSSSTGRPSDTEV